MPPIQRDPIVAAESGSTDFQIPAWQKFFHRPSIRPGLGPVIGQGIAPTNPIGLVGVIVVGQDILGSGNQVVGSDQRIRGCSRGIAQSHLIIDP